MPTASKNTFAIYLLITKVFLKKRKIGVKLVIQFEFPIFRLSGQALILLFDLA